MDQQEASVDEKEQLNAVLDAALDELDDSDDDDEEEHHVERTSAAVDSRPQQQEDTEKPTKPKRVYGPEKPPDFDIGSFDDVMKQIFEGGGDGNDPEAALDSFLQQMQTQLAAEMERMESPNKQESSSTKSDKTAAKQTNATPSTEPPSNGNDVDRTISKLLNDMATANMDEDGGAGDMPGGGEEAMFHDMMKEFEKMGGGGFDQDAVVDGMMQQLVSKDIMYEPMKQVTDRFPAWLGENKEILSEEEYKNRSKQYECFKKLIYVYENDPDNVKKLMELMQDVQEYGQPPPEIIKEIAPGLDLDEEGVPKLDGIGDNEECNIM